MNDGLQRSVAVVLLAAALPVMTVIALAIRLFDGGPVLFHSERLGKRRRRFVIWKFPTMKEWCSDEFKRYLERNPAACQEWRTTGKLICDPRATVIGRILRRSSLDELPQLWNVCRGEMALVGPRPIVAAEEALYGRYNELLHSVKPGMTGLWQVSGRNLTTYRRRIAINIYYVRHRSWKLDLWILYKTFGAVIGGRGAF